MKKFEIFRCQRTELFGFLLHKLLHWCLKCMFIQDKGRLLQKQRTLSQMTQSSGIEKSHQADLRPISQESSVVDKEIQVNYYWISYILVNVTYCSEFSHSCEFHIL